MNLLAITAGQPITWGDLIIILVAVALILLILFLLRRG
jgi:hypothetical protein